MHTYTRILLGIRYQEGYLPSPRHRKLRYRDVKEDLFLRIRTIQKTDARVAFTLSDFSHKEKHQTEVLLYNGRLYQRCWRHLTEQEHQAGLDGYAIERLEDIYREFSTYDRRAHGDETRKELIARLRAKARRYLLIGRDVWTVCGEPRYEIITFGLGHNHGGTGLFVENSYNPNISKTRYFSALDGDKAVAEFNRIAAARGDTESVGRYSKMIEVHIPECVKLNPAKEHGDGEPFHNLLDGITGTAGSATEAGLLAICATAAEIAKH